MLTELENLENRKLDW